MNNTINWLSQEDSDFLKSLRALSILIIVFGHTGGFWFYPPWSEFLHVFVAIFFFISGAVSYNSFFKKENSSRYIHTRILGIIIPYYILCAFSLLIYIAINTKIPNFDFTNFITWLALIPPGRDITLLPMGHTWFLHTLLIIIIFSPLLINAYNKNKYTIFYILIPISIASVQLFYDIDDYFIIKGHNFFKPIVHSLFFFIGIIVFDLELFNKKYISALISISMIAFSAALVYFIKLNPDYAEHTYAPDLYYVSGSIASIFLLFFFRHKIVHLYNSNFIYIKNCINFLFKHTFSIYLYHVLAIFLSQNIFGLVNPENKNVIYGLKKLFVVLSITFIISPIFTKINGIIYGNLSRKIQ